MGNQLNSYDLKETRSISKSIKSKLNKNRKSGCNLNENFIIKHIQNNKSNDDLIDIESLDPRRKVFVSLIGLYQNWKQLSSLTLYTALIILPMKKQWIYHPSKYSKQLKAISISKDVAETKLFIEFLRWKDSQQLIFWILDESVSDTSVDSVSPIWYALSNKLQSLYDPMSTSNYNPLQLDTKWWLNEQVFVSKFDTKPCEIIRELYFVTMQYKTIKELLYQSNPDTLHPITGYENDAVVTQSIFDVVSIDGDDTDWYISQDYDPYDIDINDIDITDIDTNDIDSKDDI